MGHAGHLITWTNCMGVACRGLAAIPRPAGLLPPPPLQQLPALRAEVTDIGDIPWALIQKQLLIIKNSWKISQDSWEVFSQLPLRYASLFLQRWRWRQFTSRTLPLQAEQHPGKRKAEKVWFKLRTAGGEVPKGYIDKRCIVSASVT